MGTEFSAQLLEASLATCAAIAVTALVRIPLRRIAGPHVSYVLWILVPVSALIVLLPSPSTPLEPYSAVYESVAASVGTYEGTAAVVDYESVLLTCWSIGCALMLGSMVRQHRLLLKSLGAVAPAADGMYRSARQVGPMLIGIVRPRIVVPADFESRYSEEEQRFALSHEREHRRRGDTAMNAVAALLMCLFWFNPLMYWAIRRFRLDQEFSCDARVLERTGANRARYANALLKAQLLSESTDISSVMACSWQSLHPLKERIAMLKQPLPGPVRRHGGFAVVCTLILSVSYATWAAQPADREQLPLLDANVTCVADQITQLPDGSQHLKGNVVLRGTDSAVWEWSSDNAHRADNGALTLDGNVRITISNQVIIGDRAVLAADGTIAMDEAYSSQQ